VLACGGFAQDNKRRSEIYPHLQRDGGAHHSPVPAGNTGDGISLAEQAGAVFRPRFPNAAAWMPVSIVPTKGGRSTPFPHLLDRYKPGVIAVTDDGHRFTNESNSYHDVGAAMIEATFNQKEPAVWLICDNRALRRYGLGYVKPAPIPIGGHLRSGYLKRGATVRELAQAIGLDAARLETCISNYNRDAARGEDLAFRRGSTAFNRFLGDPDHKPNPNVAPLDKPPFYAVRLRMGDLGTFDGIDTTPTGQVLDRSGAPIPGLFAVGNDRASIFGGTYPGAGITLGPIMTFGYVVGRALAGVD
jgi:succinate dehydrogenase/fumarate reductase flavoprotein subunit